MNFRIFYLFIYLLLNSCIDQNIPSNNIKVLNKNYFSNKGFAITYKETLYNNKVITKKIDNRSLIIFQKNLKKGTTVKITNILNDKYVIAKVGPESSYPIFNNAVLSERISEEIELNLDNPYIEIIEVQESSAFIAKKAKTFDEEKNVANKAPIENISVSNLNEIKNEKIIKKIQSEFDYNIKIADFYFHDSANLMANRIKNESKINAINVKKLSKNQYRVFLGPFKDIISLQKAFNDINILQFENIEIIKND